MSDHDTLHIDDDGVCRCECKLCVCLDILDPVWCTCPDCNVIACGMHGGPTA